MPFEIQSWLETNTTGKAQQNKPRSPLTMGGSWGLLFPVDGQKADTHKPPIHTVAILRNKAENVLIGADR